MAKLYEMGIHRLICGDCRKHEDFILLLQGERPDLCITSPPYNQGFNARLDRIKKKTTGGMYKHNKKFLLKAATAYIDDMPEEVYQQEQIGVMNNIYDILSEDGSLFYNHKVRYRNKQAIHPLVWITKTKFKLRQEIIWNKGTTIVQSARMFLPIDERIFWLVKGKKFYFNEARVKRYSTVWPITDRPAIKDDCLPFPNKLAYRCMLACSQEGDVVLDPYGGTGTTLIVAEQLGRVARLIEIDEARCERIKKRYEAFLQQKGAAALAQERV